MNCASTIRVGKAISEYISELSHSLSHGLTLSLAEFLLQVFIEEQLLTRCKNE